MSRNYDIYVSRNYDISNSLLWIGKLRDMYYEVVVVIKKYKSRNYDMNDMMYKS